MRPETPPRKGYYEKQKQNKNNSSIRKNENNITIMNCGPSICKKHTVSSCFPTHDDRNTNRWPFNLSNWNRSCWSNILGRLLGKKVHCGFLLCRFLLCCLSNRFSIVSRFLLRICCCCFFLISSCLS